MLLTAGYGRLPRGAGRAAQEPGSGAALPEATQQGPELHTRASTGIVADNRFPRPSSTTVPVLAKTNRPERRRTIPTATNAAYPRSRIVPGVKANRSTRLSVGEVVCGDVFSDESTEPNKERPQLAAYVLWLTPGGRWMTAPGSGS